MESLRTSLASRTSSRTHFKVLGFNLVGEVLGLGLKAYKFSKIICKKCAKVVAFFFLCLRERAKGVAVNLWSFFLENTCALCPWSSASNILVLGLERVFSVKVGPWPRIFFVSLALASSLVSSTPPLLLFLYLFLQFKSKTRLKSCILRLSFCKWFGPSRGKWGSLPPAIQGVHKVRVHFKKIIILIVFAIEIICKKDLKEENRYFLRFYWNFI